MPETEAQKRAHKKYTDAHYQQIAIRWPREFCGRLKAEAQAQGESLAGYVRKAIEQRMERDREMTDAKDQSGDGGA